MTRWVHSAQVVATCDARTTLPGRPLQFALVNNTMALVGTGMCLDVAIYGITMGTPGSQVRTRTCAPPMDLTPAPQARTSLSEPA